MDASTFARVRDLVQQAAGIELGADQSDMVSTRLARRLAATGHRDIAGYLDYLAAGAEDERGHLVSAMTTNFTRFFREEHHFDRLAEIAAAAKRANRPLRVWSAGCSSGQEAYSIAITLAAEGFSADTAQILATDIDKEVLRQAMAAAYTTSELESLAASARGRACRAADGGAGIPAAIRAMVQFKPLNLTHSWPIQVQLDVIFCRNVAIYFSEATQSQLWSRLIGALRPGGWLFVGHSERLPDSLLGRMSLRGQTSYTKTATMEGNGGQCR